MVCPFPEVVRWEHILLSYATANIQSCCSVNPDCFHPHEISYSISVAFLFLFFFAVEQNERVYVKFDGKKQTKKTPTMTPLVQVKPQRSRALALKLDGDRIETEFEVMKLLLT